MFGFRIHPEYAVEGEVRKESRFCVHDGVQAVKNPPSWCKMFALFLKVIVGPAPLPLSPAQEASIFCYKSPAMIVNYGKTVVMG